MEELNNIKKAFDTFCEEMEKVFGKSSEEKLGKEN